MADLPLKTFIIYAHADETHKNALLRHLKFTLVADQKIEVWHDADIPLGSDWDKTIKHNLETSDLVLVLVSVDSLSSEYIHSTELRIALSRLREGVVRVVPIVVDHCGWKHHPVLRGLQGLPKGMVPVAEYSNPNKAWTEIIDALVTLTEEVFEQRTAAELLKKAEIERVAEEKRQIERKKKAEEVAEKIRAADELVWQTTVSENTIEAYERYLKGSFIFHRGEATEKLKILERKKEAADRPKNGQVKRDLPDTPEMVFVEGGSFQMGSNEYDSEKPIHTVQVKPFWMGKYPVTVADFKAFVGATKYPTDAEKEGWSYVWTGAKWEEKKGVTWRDDMNGNRRPDNERQHPVIHVSWNDANAYCEWLSKKTGKNYCLPSEAEWEFAARGGSISENYKFAGSDDLKEVGWFSENSGGKTQPVGGKKANELGIYDMSGNVWEWCADVWHPNYQGAPADGSAWLGAGSARVRRGGGWIGGARYCRAAIRDGNSPEFRWFNYGFRLALSLQSVG